MGRGEGSHGQEGRFEAKESRDADDEAGRRKKGTVDSQAVALWPSA